jgi:hypothetical protein
MRTGLVFALTWALTAGYRYARNVLHTGDPAYPAAFLFWPGATFPETTLVEYARRYGFQRTMVDTLRVYLNWPRLHALLAVAGLAGLAVWLVLHRRVLTRAQRYFGGGALALAATILILLPAVPYSAGNAMTFRSGLVHWASMRYVALVPILGWVALGFVLGSGVRAGKTIAALLVAAAALLTSGNDTLASPAALVVLAIGAAVMPHPRLLADRWRALPLRRDVLAVSAGALAVAGIVAWSHGTKAAATAAAFHGEPLFGGAAAVLDRQPEGTQVALSGDQLVYPGFGERDHLRPVRLDGDGRLARTLIGDAMAPSELTVAPPTFRANLQASGIGLVVVVHLPHPGRSLEWPSQQATLEAMEGARVLYQDRSVAVWRLEP